MAHKDDIYKKESVPFFARRNYKKSRYGSVDKHPETATDSRRARPQGVAGKAGPSRFEGRMQGQSRSRGGSGSSRGKRSSRAPEGNKTNLIIVGILLFAFATYAGILGYVKMKASRGSGTPPPTYEEPGQVASGTDSVKEPDSVVAPSTPAVSEVATNQALQVDQPVNEFILDLKKAYKEIKAVDTPLNTAAPSETIARLEKQLVTTPDLLDLKVELARRYLANEQYSEAAKQLTGILGAEPYNMSARLMLAQAFVEAADYTSAIQVSQWILEEDKFSTEARNTLANCYMKLGNYTRAIDHLRALANENSLDVVVQNNLGVAHSRMKRYDLAIPIFEKTIRIDKANAVGYFNLAICHAQQNMAQKACDVIYRASDQFGPSFVAQWITSKQFSPIAASSPFERLKSRFRVYINEPESSTAVLLQGEEKPTAPFGKAALPEFDVTEK